MGKSEREKRAEIARRHYFGTQYDHLKPWDSDELLRKRKPSVQCRITKQVIDTVCAYLFGEGNAPVWDAENETPEIKQRLQEIISFSGIEWKYNQLARQAALTGTVAIAFHQFSNGRMDIEVLHAEHCIPKFGYENRNLAIENNIDFDDLLSLDHYWIENAPNGEKYVHRRTWTLKDLNVYKPRPHSFTNLDDSWVVDQEASVKHNLGFVPVAWIRLIEADGDVDGVPILSSAEFAIEDEINYTLSQLGRAIQYTSEPKTIFTDVDNLDITKLDTGSSKSWRLQSSPITGGKQAKVELLEMSGTGQEKGFEYVDKIRWAIYQAARVVEHNPESFAGVLSGTALKLQLTPMVAMINDVRPQFEKGIGRLLSKMMHVNGFKNVSVIATWPDVVPRTDSDLQMMVSSIIQLLDFNLITERTAVSFIAPFFGIDDVDSYIPQLIRDTMPTQTVDIKEKYKDLFEDPTKDNNS